MQISLTIPASSNPPYLHHHHLNDNKPPPTFNLSFPNRTGLGPGPGPGRVEAGRGSGQPAGVFSVIGRAMEEEEYRKARAEVHRKGFEIEGFNVEGMSVGGHETCVILPEFKSVFDMGRCPLRAVHQNFVFITHGHLDHIASANTEAASLYHRITLQLEDWDGNRGASIEGAANGMSDAIFKLDHPEMVVLCLSYVAGGLPMYVATRALYSLKPPTIFVPPCLKEDVEKLFEIHRSMGQVDLEFDLVALDVGETYELRDHLVVRPFQTHHVIPSQGYVLYTIRKKLKKQYIHLKGKQIEKLKKSGVEITDMILSPEVAFTGDTTSDFLLEPRNADALRAKLLITEATFLDEGFSVEHARERGHTHLFELLEHARWIRNKTVLLTHFSSRYHLEDIRQAVSKLQARVSAKVVPLTEGFKSMYT